MKKSAIVCAVLAGTFGLTSVASAQDWRGRGDDRRHDRAEQRQDRREARQERRDDRRDRQEQRVDRAWNQGYRAAQEPRYVQQILSQAGEPLGRGDGGVDAFRLDGLRVAQAQP